LPEQDSQVREIGVSFDRRIDDDPFIPAVSFISVLKSSIICSSIRWFSLREPFQRGIFLPSPTGFQKRRGGEVPACTTSTHDRSRQWNGNSQWRGSIL
jgi:hypothetical protein